MLQGCVAKSMFMGAVQPLEMGNIHTVLSEFTEIGHGAKKCLTLGNWVSAKKGSI